MSAVLVLSASLAGFGALISMKHGTPSGAAAALLLSVILGFGAIAI